MSSAPWGGQTESTTSLAAARAATVPASSSSAVAARAQVSVLRPSEAQSTRRPTGARRRADRGAHLSGVQQPDRRHAVPPSRSPILPLILGIDRFTTRPPGCLPVDGRRSKGVTTRRQELLSRIERAWGTLKESYAGSVDRELRSPGVTGDWSVQDILAHVTTWEEEALRYLPRIVEGGTPPRYSTTYGGIDAFNAQMTARQGATCPCPRCWYRSTTCTAGWSPWCRAAPEAEIASDTRFRRRLRLDTYSHYPKHAEAIRAWRGRPAIRMLSAR